MNINIFKKKLYGRLIDKSISIIIAAMLIFSSLPIDAFAVIYAPGETLNPACAPTDVNCGVTPPLSSSTTTPTTASTFSGTSTSTPSTFVYATSTNFEAQNATTSNLSATSGVIATLAATLANIATAIVDTFTARLATIYSATVGTLTATSTAQFLAGASAPTFTATSTTATSTFAGKVDIGSLKVGTGNGLLSATNGFVTAVATSTLGLITTNVAEGSNLYYTDTRARTAQSNTATGLTYTAGTGVTSLTAGYSIPLTASSTSWNTFYNTPSNRITAGAGLTWSTNTLAVNTAALTLASATTDGIVSTTTQTFAGSKTFTGLTSLQSLTAAGTTTLATTTATNLTATTAKIGTLGGLLFGTAGNVGTIATSSLGFREAITGTQGQTITFDSSGVQTAASTLFISGGNVGVGTTTPSTKLAVSGNTAITAGMIATTTTRSWDPATDSADISTARVVHLRANELTSAGALASWTDQSGSGFSPAQATGANQPTVTLNGINSYSYATFDGANDELQATLTGFASAPNFTVFTVSYPTTGSIVSQIGNNASNQAVGHGYNVGNTLRTYVYGQGQADDTGVTLNNWHITMGSKSGTALTSNLDGGTAVTSTAGSAGALPVNPVMALGSQSGTPYYQGRIAEYMLYSSALSAADTAKVEGYLAWKYGLQGNLPAGHTYKNAAPTAPVATTTIDPSSGNLTVSNSITAGSLSLGSLSGLLFASAGSVSNFATSTVAGRVLSTNASGTLEWITPVSTSATTTINGASGPTFTFNAGAGLAISTSTNSLTFTSNYASATADGIVSTTTQTFAGAKTFSGAVTVAGNTTLASATSTNMFATNLSGTNGNITGISTVGSLKIDALSGLLFGTAGNVGTIATSTLGLLTTNVAEGINLYYTQARFDTALLATTTSALAEGSRLYYTDARARTALSSSATGLTYASSTGAFSLTSGYNIPLTASTTNWDTFYNTPSNRITAGTGLAWSGNILNVTASGATTTINGASGPAFTFNAGAGLAISTSTNSLTFTPSYAGATTDGIVSTTTQTFAGAKTFSGSATLATTTVSNLLTANAGLALASSTPLATANTLYNEGGTLKWNGSQVGGSANAFVNNGNAFGGLASLGTTDNNSLRIIASSTEAMRILANGNIGIGTTTPSTKLAVSGNTAITAGMIATTTTRSWDPATDSADISTARVVHLRANELTSAGALASWTDQSGSGFSPAQATGANQPTVTLNGINSYSYATFDGANDELQATLTGFASAPNFTVFTVSYPTTGSIVSQIGNNASNQAVGHGYNVGNTLRTYVYGQGQADDTGVTLNNWHITMGSKSGTALTSNLDGGTAVTSTAGSAGALPVNPVMALGSQSGTPYYQGRIAEYMLYSSALSAADTAKVEGYLAWKYGLQGNLPAGHTYKNAAPTAPVATTTIDPSSGNLTVSNSITAGSLSLGSLSGLLFANAGSVSNFATSTVAGRVLSTNASGTLEWITPVSTSATTTINGASGPTFTFNAGAGLAISTSTNSLTFTPSYAGAATDGIVSTTTQTFAGAKTFSGTMALATTTISKLTIDNLSGLLLANAGAVSNFATSTATTGQVLGMQSGALAWVTPTTAATTAINGASGPNFTFNAGAGLAISTSTNALTFTPSYAGATTDGIVSTTTQTFAGAKTFSGSATLATTTVSNLLTANAGLALASSTPLATANTLYNKGNSLYWNGALVNNGSVVGVDWTAYANAVTNNWKSVTYGNGLFVAVSNSGSGNRVMISSNGATWTASTGIANNSWNSVTYGNNLFVAVAMDGTNQVMTSSDGITWTAGIGAVNNQWMSVTYGNGLFAAVSQSGTGNRVMTSPDGITWTSRATPADNNWNSVTYGNGLFVAVSNTGNVNRVMTSPDGITWTIRTSALDIEWTSVTYGNGLFVAVAKNGTGNRVMTSTDGVAWTSRATPADNNWNSVTYGNGLFVAVAWSGTGNRVMTSSDGITWTLRTSAVDNNWVSVTYGNGLFVAVADAGTSNRVMNSGTQSSSLTGLQGQVITFTATGAQTTTSTLFISSLGNIGIGTTSPSTKLAVSGNTAITAGMIATTTTRSWDPATDSADISTARVVHLRANELTSAGALASWTDQSSNAFSPAQATGANQPTVTLNGINSYSYATFDGANDELQATLTGFATAPNFTVFTVSYPVNELPVMQIGNNAPDQAVGHGYNVLNTLRTYVWGQGQADDSGVTLNNWHITMGSKSGTALTSNLDGGTAATSTAGSAGALPVNPVMALGSQLGTAYYQGRVAEYVLYSGVLSAADTAKVEGYLAWKYGLQGNLPAGHTYKNAAPTAPVAATIIDPSSGNLTVSNSITAGSLSLGSLSGLLFASAGSVSNFATSSATAGQVLGMQGGALAWVNQSAGGSATTTINGASGPSFTFNAGAGLAISTSTNALTFTSNYASATADGIVSTSTQTFAGAKTFSNALTVNNNLTATGTLSVSGTATSSIAGALNSGNLHLVNSNSVIGLNTGGSRLRVTAGFADTDDNDQGANVDLHSVANGGGLDLVAGRGGAITFWTSTSTQTAQQRAVLDQDGRLTLDGGLTANAGLALASSTPLATANTLYNEGGTLKWNGSAVGSGSSQWTTTGPNIYYNTGNVGIGTTTPSSKLVISGPVTNATTTRSWDPATDSADISTARVVHLRANELTSAGALASWTDQSSNAFSPAQATGANQPTVTLNGINSYSYATFDGANDDLQATLTGFATAPNFTVFTVSYPTTGNVVAQIGNGALNQAVGHGYSGTSLRTYVWGQPAADDTGVTLNNWHITMGSKSGTALTSNLDGGTPTTSTSGSAGALPANPIMALGSQLGTGYYNGRIAEYMLYNGVLSAADTAKVEGYLAWKYGLQGNLPAGHTYKNAAPTAPVNVPANQQTMLLRVTDTGTAASSTLAFFEGTSGQGCIIAGSTGLSCSSDITLKKHINALENSLGNVLALKAVTYDWKNGANDMEDESGITGSNVGFIAQDVEKIFPGLVRFDPNGNRTLAYDKFAPIIVAALQEQYGGLMGINLASVENLGELFATEESLENDNYQFSIFNFQSISNDENDQTEGVVGYLQEKVVSGIKIVRELVTERVVAVNGYFKRIFANELCLTDASGQLVCVTGENLKQIGGTQIAPSSAPTPEPQPEADRPSAETPEPEEPQEVTEPEVVVDLTSSFDQAQDESPQAEPEVVVETEPASEPTPEPVTEPEVAPEPEPTPDLTPAPEPAPSPAAEPTPQPTPTATTDEATE